MFGINHWLCVLCVINNNVIFFVCVCISESDTPFGLVRNKSLIFFFFFFIKKEKKNPQVCL